MEKIIEKLPVELKEVISPKKPDTG